MSKIDKIRELFRELHIPAKQQNDMCCLTFLALGELEETTPWKDACNNWLRIHDLLAWMNSRLGATYAENTRETIRKHAIHFFRDAAIIEDNGLATNSPNYRYRLTDEILQIIRRLDTQTWTKRCAHFLKSHRSLIEKYASNRRHVKIPVQINESEYSFSPGKHNGLQKAILEEFAPRFAPGSRCLYVGDTVDRALYLDKESMSEIGIELSVHDKLPDVVLYAADKDWLYFIEAVTSCGPISPARKNELEKITLDTTSGIIYITAFPDIKTYHRFSQDLAWDTEVWLSNAPDHMIHLNGDRFIGPR